MRLPVEQKRLHDADHHDVSLHCEELLKKGTDPNALNGQQPRRTALEVVALSGSKALRMLLERYGGKRNVARRENPGTWKRGWGRR